jgi:hypothetical protein
MSINYQDTYDVVMHVNMQEDILTQATVAQAGLRHSTSSCGRRVRVQERPFLVCRLPKAAALIPFNSSASPFLS